MPDDVGSIAVLLVLVVAVLELFWLLVVKRVSFRRDFFQPIKNIGLVIAAATVITRIIPTVGWALLGATLAPFELPNEWYAWPIGLVVYEFWYWVQHFAAHKVRLLWCIHSPHHAPPTINLLVGTNHHFIEGLIYFPFFFGFMPALFGIPVEIIAVISLVDQCWGSMLHVSADVVKRRYGVLEHFMQTPSYHRVHHAKNVRYMDTNYNSITLLWDTIMGTRQTLLDDEPVDYGITREVNTESLMAVQFGEFRALWRDVKAAPSVVNKVAYCLMPPGWSHDGNHQMVSTQQRELGI
ncbi:MAG: sterol desaturase family protein [Pseudomonadales bacterium]